jgi:Fe-S-cluster-containing dehydrogenase component
MAQNKNAIFINYEFCSGCHSCEIACRNELELGVDDWGIKVLEDGPRQHFDGSWHWDYVALPTELCDLCEKRVAQGILPSCVQCCQGKVLEFGTIEECAKKLAEKGSKVAIFIP